MWQKIKNVYHLGIAVLACIYYGFPSRKLRVIAVTGTDGKTTTTSLIYHVLNNAGYSASMITSVGAVINGKNYDIGFHVTTPSSFAIQRFLKKASATLPSFLILEVTSHALDQNRVWGIDFEVGVITNITHEHLDYHKSYENYVKTKANLLKMSKIAVVNRDDKSYSQISNLKFLSPKLVTYGMDDADINPKKFPFKTSLIGEFNKYNILAAVGVCKSLGLPDDVIRKGIESFNAPVGREDVVYKKDFTVMIDFAHTPNAFEQILSSIKPKVKGRLIHVFGSAGARDTSKRPLMGEVSDKYADIIILTAEDPRKETVGKITDEIASGVKSKKKILKIPDRKKAIFEAIKMAKKGDFIIFTGKSHEKSMNYGHGEVSWDEYKIVKDALKQL